MITLWSFQALELYFVSTHLKKIYRKNSDFKKISILCFLALSGRPLAEQNCSVGRPGGRPMCMCAHRSTGPVDRQKEQSSLFFPVDRSGRPIESVEHSLFGNFGRPSGRPLSQRSKIRPLAVDRPGRPAAEKSAVLAANGYILFYFLLGLLPTDLLVFLT